MHALELASMSAQSSRTAKAEIEFITLTPSRRRQHPHWTTASKRKVKPDLLFVVRRSCCHGLQGSSAVSLVLLFAFTKKELVLAIGISTFWLLLNYWCDGAQMPGRRVELLQRARRSRYLCRCTLDEVLQMGQNLAIGICGVAQFDQMVFAVQTLKWLPCHQGRDVHP